MRSKILGKLLRNFPPIAAAEEHCGEMWVKCIERKDRKEKSWDSFVTRFFNTISLLEKQCLD